MTSGAGTLPFYEASGTGDDTNAQSIQKGLNRLTVGDHLVGWHTPILCEGEGNGSQGCIPRLYVKGWAMVRKDAYPGSM